MPKGIQWNVAAVNELYGRDWTVRLYHNIKPGEEVHGELCTLACSLPILDLCYTPSLPYPPTFPTLSRFLPTLDPQVVLVMVVVIVMPVVIVMVMVIARPRLMCWYPGTWTRGQSSVRLLRWRSGWRPPRHFGAPQI